MRNNLFALAAVAAVALTSAPAFAGDHGPSQYDREAGFQQSASYGYQGSASALSTASVKVTYLNELSKAERAQLNSRSNPAAIEALHASIDGKTAAELRAKGVQVQNIVGSAQPFNGRTIYFVK